MNPTTAWNSRLTIHGKLTRYKMKAFIMGAVLAVFASSAYAYSKLDSEVIQEDGGKKNKICIYKNGETRTIKHYQQCPKSID